MRRPDVLILAALLGSCSDSISLREFGAELVKAQACSPGDTCVLFTPYSECLCAVAVNAKELDRITSRSADVDCDGAMASCPVPPANPQCIDGVCKELVEHNPDGGVGDAAAD